ncbi:hypothetical protein OROGR_008083 [Orobanche gracilis]
MDSQQRSHKRSKLSSSGSKRSKNSSSGSKRSKHYSPTLSCFLSPDREGALLMVVFNIMYLGSDEIDPMKQLGTIGLFSGPTVQYLYNVEAVDSSMPTIRYGDAVDVTVKGPTAFSREDDDYVSIKFDLFSSAYKGIVDLPCSHYDKHEVSLGCVELGSTDCTGRILVNIGHFANATIANLEVRLLDNFATTNIYGVIFASNNKLDSSDSATVLFRKRPGNIVKVGHNDLIPLSKSLVGVPLHSVLFVEVFLNINGDNHKAIVSFDAKESGEDEKCSTTDKDAMIRVKVTWSVDEGSIYQQCYDKISVNQTTTNLPSVDRIGFEVEEAVAYEFCTLSHKIKKWLAKKPVHHISLSTKDLLIEIMFYSTDRVRPFTYVIDFVSNRVVLLDSVGLFNLIQAAHHLEIKSIMDLTCRTLVKKVKTKTIEDIMKEFDLDEACIQSAKRLKSSIKDPESLNVESILRQRRKETFIDKSRLVDVPISPFATERQCLVKNRFCDFVESAVCKHRDMRKMLEAIKWLNNLIDGDVGFADCLSVAAVEHFLQIVTELDNSTDIDLTIQSGSSHPLACSSREKFYEYWRQAIPAFVDLMSDRLTDLNILGVIALRRLAYASAYCKQVILDHAALEKVQKIANKFESSFPPNVPELIHEVAKFLAVVCCTYLPDDKSFQKELRTYQHIESVCYALQYLTYERTVAFEGEAWNKIIKRLIGFISNCFSIEDIAALVLYLE